MSKFNIAIHHAKLLNFLDKRNKEIEKSKINLRIAKKQYSIGILNPYIEDLKQEQAIVEEDKKIYLTSKGKELLKNNQHLLKRFKATKIKKHKTHCHKAVPSEEDIAIINYITNLANQDRLKTIKMSDMVDDLKVSRQLITRRLKKLKENGYLNFTPRQYGSLSVTEKGNKLIN